MNKEINKTYLKGLKCKSSVKKDGVWKVLERPMRPDDVLDCREDGQGNMVIVAADGSKHTVPMETGKA